ncbi:Gfo/Idh/MocA family protein [Leptospira noguchii]|uniref:Oxidoreductase, NAD-binding domain protein n=1 Tax=Leptospira noguchii TaxID=28182 RepID=M6VVA8_9LEPT|nr:Gfo/Idh/MocA family oxidoreductase [Leptospira noguchii]EMO53483.1 oxidoreductase, NAD-binding domain protein [Leptospira noguchii]
MLNFALIGCGRISVRHSDLLGNNVIQNARLAAVCDIDLKKAEILGKKYNVPVYSDMHEMMRKEDIDVAVVLTPSGFHAEHVIQIAKYNKHIIVEKPMALTLEDADLMIQACDESGCKLFVVKQNRFNVPVLKLREALNAKRFGKLVMGTIRVRWCRDQRYYNQDSWRGTWAFDGGVLTNQASHHIDLLEWMMGDVESVFARGVTSLVDIETEDTAVATIKFKNGALGIVEATTAARPVDLEGSISILGEKGTVVIGGFAVNKIQTWKFSEEAEEDNVIIEKYSVNPPNVYGYGHQAYYEHVVDCVVNQKAALVDGLKGRKSLELITAMYESIETGKEVFLRFQPNKCKLGIRNS